MKKTFCRLGTTFASIAVCLTSGTNINISSVYASTNIYANPHSQAVNDNILLLGRLPLRRLSTRKWVDNIPRRNIARWIDREKGIYQSTRGYTFGSYRDLEALDNETKRSLLKPEFQATLQPNEKIHAHHIIEKRFAKYLRIDEDDLPAVLIPHSFHTGRGVGIHSIFRQIPELRQKPTRVNAEEWYKRLLPGMNRAYQRIYSELELDDWAEAVEVFMKTYF